jgi:hypothetical protein
MTFGSCSGGAGMPVRYMARDRNSWCNAPHMANVICGIPSGSCPSGSGRLMLLSPKAGPIHGGQAPMTAHQPAWVGLLPRSGYTWIAVNARGLADHSTDWIPLRLWGSGLWRLLGPCINQRPRNGNLRDLPSEDRRTCFWPELNHGYDLRRPSSSQPHLPLRPSRSAPNSLTRGRN